MSDNSDRDELIIVARRALEHAYAPYSNFRVGAALRFADGTLVAGTNVENASFGLSLCAETVAVAKAMGEGHRGGLEAVAIYGDGSVPVTPCGRCRQILHELAQLGGTDPVIWCAADGEVLETRLSALLPNAFGPGTMV